MLIRALSGSGGGGGTKIDLSKMKCVALPSNPVYAAPASWTVPRTQNAYYLIATFGNGASYTLGQEYDLTDANSSATVFSTVIFDESGNIQKTNFSGNPLTYSGGVLSASPYGYNSALFSTE